MNIKNYNKMKFKLSEEYFKKIVYWIICKYSAEKINNTSTKKESLGDFIDRMINKAPEFLIFEELLKDKEYSVVTDTFIYTTEKSKNAPDILGLIDNNGKVYPFAKFRDDNWEFDEKTPFIEMKTFRNNQSLITIPYTQFHDNHYYAIVESHLEEDYLLSIFENEFFENDQYYKNITNLNKEFIISNKKGIVKIPEKIKKNTSIGYYSLLGIYKGCDLKKYSKIIEQGNNPIYFFEETNPPTRFQKRFEVNPPLKLNTGIHYFDDDTDNIPFDIKVLKDSEIIVKYKTKRALDVCVKGHVEVDGKRLSQGMRRLQFRNFEKNGNIKEIVMTKSILECYHNEISSNEELIEKFDKIVGKK